MSKFTNKSTIRYIRYRDEFQLKDDQNNVNVPSKLFLKTIENKGWPPFYYEDAKVVKRFFDTYVITKTLAKNLMRKHRKVDTRIIVLAKRQIGM